MKVFIINLFVILIFIFCVKSSEVNSTDYHEYNIEKKYYQETCLDLPADENHEFEKDTGRWYVLLSNAPFTWNCRFFDILDNKNGTQTGFRISNNTARVFTIQLNAPGIETYTSSRGYNMNYTILYVKYFDDESDSDDDSGDDDCLDPRGDNDNGIQIRYYCATDGSPIGLEVLVGQAIFDAVYGENNGDDDSDDDSDDSDGDDKNAYRHPVIDKIIEKQKITNTNKDKVKVVNNKTKVDKNKKNKLDEIKNANKSGNHDKSDSNDDESTKEHSDSDHDKDKESDDSDISNDSDDQSKDWIEIILRKIDSLSLPQNLNTLRLVQFDKSCVGVFN